MNARLEGARLAAGKLKREERDRAGAGRQAEQGEATAARRAWVVEFVALPPAEQLRRIADDKVHPLGYFPAASASVDDATVRSLDPQLRQKLLDLLKDRRRGPWKNLRLALLAASTAGRPAPEDAQQ